jgi:hypothetical protein
MSIWLVAARLVAVTSTVAIGSACSWQQAYSAAQGWQRNQCNKQIEQTDHDRCLSKASMSYENYRRQTEGAKKN